MRFLLDDLAASFAFLTRLPLPTGKETQPDLARAVWAFPLVGAFVGLAGGCVLYGAHLAGVGPWLAAGLAILAQVLLTGALHEDGLADVADGFGGGQTREKRLEIMRDSRIGTYGVVALILVTGLRWGALASLEIVHAALGLIIAGATSRLAIVIVLTLLPSARKDGLGAMAAEPPPLTTGAAAAITCAVALLLMPPHAATGALVMAALAAALTAWIAKARIGGFTGDVLGACAQVAEAAVLIGLVALAARGAAG